MKVLFCNPPWWEERSRVRTAENVEEDIYRFGVRAGSRWPFTMQSRIPPGHFVPGLYLPYPFFLGYATTYAARETDAEISFRDSVALREGYDQFFEFLKTHHFDLIVIESATPSWAHDKQLIKEISRRLPDTRFALTGPIAVSAENIMETLPQVQAVIKGEYEKNIVKVIKGASGLIDFDLLTLEEMNTAPYPYFDGAHAYQYFDANPRGQIYPHAQVWSSRGCPYKCIFCVWPASMTGSDPDGKGKRTVRHYSPEYMEGFLSELVGKYDYKSIYFDDDTFNLGDNHVEAMCKVMRKIGVPWSAMCRTDTSRMDLWKEMRSSGCFGVKLGFESGNQWVVDNIVNKRLDLNAARKVVREIKRLGMSVHGTFTFGLPGETAEQMKDTERYIETLELDTIQKSGCAAIEGTPLHTLNQAKHLDSYKGAQSDESYIQRTDGAKKFNELFQELASSSLDSQFRITLVDSNGTSDKHQLTPSGWDSPLILSKKEVSICYEINQTIPGRADTINFVAYRELICKSDIRKVLVIGTYMGRDIAYLMALAKHANVQIELVGMDRFTDEPCADWPEEKKTLSWEMAGYGPSPDINETMRYLNDYGVTANIRLIKGRDEEYLVSCSEDFDLIVLDTALDYNTIKRQIACSKKLLRPQGYLVGSGYLGVNGVRAALSESFKSYWLVENDVWLVQCEYQSNVSRVV